MSDSHDERLKKLMDRTNEPLPNYSSEGIKGGVKINFEENISEGREVVSKELFSDRKSKKMTEMDSHRKNLQAGRRDEPSRQQTTLDNYNFYLKPNIENKKVKRVYSDSNNMDMLAEMNSNASDSNHSSDRARALFSNGGKQVDKIDQFITMQPAVCNSESKGFQCPDDYSQYVLREKREYVEQIERYQLKVDHLKQDNAQKAAEIKSLRKQIDKMNEDMAYFDHNKTRICSIVLELETLRSIMKRTELASMKIKLGHIESTGNLGGSKSDQKSFWVDGTEFLAKKKSLEEINTRKSLLENYKRSVKVNRRMSGVENQASPYEEFGEDEMLFTYLMKEDPKESAKRLDDVISRLTNEEKDLNEQLEKLESDRVKMIQMERTMIDESKSTFGRPDFETSRIHWPLFETYQLVGLLGKGGFSEVYKAFDLKTYTYRAFKLHKLLPQWDAAVRANYVRHTTREFQVQKEIIHENILRHYDVIEISETEFATVLQLCEGPDLSTYLKIKKCLPEKEAKNITRQILTALKYLNDRNIIHYDLKPGNILFDRGFIKVADFGLCKQMDEGMKEIDLTSFGVGTYWYLPPETFNCDEDSGMKISPKVDIWSVGVILYEMLYSQKPFGQGLTQNEILRRKVMLAAKKVEFPAKPTVSNEIKDFIRRCLCYSKEERIDIAEAYDLFCR